MTILDLPEHLMARMVGPYPPVEFVSNGCTCSPDEVDGVDLRPSCHWHDFRYSIPGTEDDRRQADKDFRWNLMQCGASRRLAGVYYRRVRWFGVDHWTYSDDSKPTGFWAKLKLLLDRYVKM